MALAGNTAIIYNFPSDNQQKRRGVLPMENAFKVPATPQSLDDELRELLAAIVQRDQAALSQLYDLTVERVYGLARGLTGNPADAEEVVGDVYLQIWQRATQYDPERGPVIAWLLINSRSLTFDLLRRRQAQQTGKEKLSQQVVDETDATTAADLVNLLQESSAVRQALAELPEEQSRLIALAFFHDMSHREIADAVQMPLGTVKSHIRRGLQSLREAIER